MTTHQNKSGIEPTEYKVLVSPKPIEGKIGNILLPESTQTKEKFAATEGRIVAISHLAFTYVEPDMWGDKKPKPGDMVLHAKYAGIRVKGRDGEEYILVNDKDVCAIIEE